MKRALLPFFLWIMHPAAAYGQDEPGTGDPRLQTILYQEDQIVPLRLLPGYQLTVELAPDERIENIAVGDSGAWQVTPNKRGDHFFVKALAAGVSTNMTVVTDARTYVFELIPFYGTGAEMAYKLRFRYTASVSNGSNAAPPTVAAGRYHITGARSLRPETMEDDGKQTRIRWAEDQLLPAMFIVDNNRQERPIDGAMRDGVFVIDSVQNQLVFRLDKAIARVKRVPKLKVR
jgi:type IV secretion system protein VirB9